MLTPEQIALRRFRIGGSEVGALLGVDPYKTALDLFTTRVHNLELHADDEEEKLHQRWGLRVERPALEDYAARAGWKLRGCPGTLVDERFPSLCATPDDIAETRDGLAAIDAKNVNRWNAEEWGEPGTDQAPMMYLAQMQVQIALTQQLGGGPRSHLIAAIAGDPPAAFPITYDPETFGIISELADKFVRDHLRTGRPPDGWERDRHAADYVAKRWAKSTEGVRPATPADLAALQLLRATEEKLEACKLEHDAAKAVLAARVGDAKGIEKVARWVDVEPGKQAVTDWQMLAQELAVEFCKLGGERDACKALLEKWTAEKVVRSGYRYLLPFKPRKPKNPTAPAQAAAHLEQ